MYANRYTESVYRKYNISGKIWFYSASAKTVTGQ